VVARSNHSDVVQLADESGMAFVDFVADAKLTVLVVAHPIHLALFSEQ
jgi:hypothetical protein